MKKQRTNRLFALMLALVMILTMLPAGVLAADTTIAGSFETVAVGEDPAALRENDFNKGWKFYLGDNGSASGQNFDDSGWENVNLPHDFSITQHFTASGEAESGFLPGGTGWYRKHFVLDDSHAGKAFLLNFDGVYMHAYVYVNGTFVGEHHYGYTSFAFDITEYLTCDGVTENVVAVKAVNQLPSSRWYSGSGIYRDVTLYAMDKVHVDLNGVRITTPDISSGNGTTSIVTELVNDGDASVTATVTSTVRAKGTDTVLATASAAVTVAAGSTSEAATAPVVSDPRLWSVESPNLYTVTTEVTVGGQVVDTCTDDFGYRWFNWNSSGFHLNGQAVKLNGVCMHHDQGALGSAAYYDAIYRQMTIMKDMGANAIRVTHNPASADLIAVCNELGLLVIEESFDGLIDPKNDNSNDFSTHFEQSAHAGLYGYVSGMTCAEYSVRSNIKRDRNAPSVIAWSFGNEIQEGTYWTNTSRYDDICANYISWVNDEDGTRVVTSGDNNRGSSQDLVNVINTITNAGGIAGFNYANSISTLSSLASRFGGSNGVIIASETASATNSRGQYRNQNNNSSSDSAYHLTSYDTSKVNWGLTAHDSIYNTYNLDNVAGEFVWTGFDYIGEPTPWNRTSTGDEGRGAIPNSSYFGIVETTGFEKDSYYLYRSQWNKNDTTVHLVTAWDSDNQYVSGGKTPVWVYTNAAKVELYLNDALIGTTNRTVNRTDAGHIFYTYTATSENSNVCSAVANSGADALYTIFNVAYTAGTLKAVAYDENNVELDTYSVSTPGAVTKLVASADKTEIDANGYDLVYVEVDVTDGNGNLDTTATNNITFTLSGPGEIAGVDNGDQATVSKYQNSNVLTDRQNANINAYAGKALVIIRSTQDAGEITLNIASNGLSGQTVTITSSPDSTDTGEGLVSYGMIRDYSVKVGTQPALDSTAIGTLSDGSTVSGSIVWDTIPSETYNAAGDYTIYGTLTLRGFEPIPVSAQLHVIPNIIDLRNISLAVMEGNAPTLPNTVRGVLADGTLSGEFVVDWEDVDASDYDTVGEIVTVNGTAIIFGKETMDVTCTVRVAEAVNTESTNIAPMADSLTQDIPAGYESDVLTSITNGTLKPGDNTNERWTNWNYRTRSENATLTLTWATAQMIGSVNLYYYYDNCCAYPESIEFSYSLNGQEYQVIDHTPTQIETYNLGEMWTYTFDEPVNPVSLKVKLTQQSGTSGTNCVGLTELEVMTYAASFEMNTSADLSGIAVDGNAIDGFAPDTLTYEVDGSAVTADTAVNAGITILPAYEGIVRILTVSEDGSAARTYAVTVGESCEHGSTTVQGAITATCTTEGHTGSTVCADCGHVIDAGSVIPALGHSWSGWSITDATCTASGSRTRSCSACGESETETIPATGHQHTEVRDAAAADCDTAGYTGDTWCTDCGTKISTGTTIAPTGHKWNAGVITQEPTASADGVKTYTCTVCGDTKTEAVKYQAELKAPSVSMTLSTSSTGKIVMTAQVDDYENLDDYYEITSHGILYVQASRIGSRTLTVNTSGRTRVTFTGYNDDGTFIYNLKPSSKSTVYALRAFITYKNTKTGATVTAYSDMFRTSYNGIKG